MSAVPLRRGEPSTAAMPLAPAAELPQAAAPAGLPHLPPPRRRLTRRLDVRIVALFLALLLLVQLATFATVDLAIAANARVQIGAELRVGEKVLDRLLAQSRQKLEDGARLLAADYGFRSAVGSGDRETILDALHNQGERIGAGAAVFVDASRRPVASTMPDPSALLEAAAAAATEGGSAVHLVGGQPYQVVSVPVRAPHVIGHVTMGFALDRQLLRDLEDVTNARMVLLLRQPGRPWQPLLVSDAPGLREAVDALPAAATPADARLDVAGEAHGYVLRPLASTATHEAAALLALSIDGAVAPYRRLQFTLLTITLIGLLVAVAGSALTARRIIGPIRQLAGSAERLGRGDYSEPVQVASDDEVGDLAGSFESMRQAVQQREAQVRRLAYWDTLTGLPNREQMRALIAARLQACRRDGAPLAVLILDLDRFKHINDNLGHPFGDRVLKQIASRLTGGAVRDGDVVGRLSGDEFAVCLPDADADLGLAIAQRLRATLEKPLALDDQRIDVGASVGVACFPRDGADPDVLLSRAEIAMYAAKERGSGAVAYEPALDSASAESLSLLSELRMAVEHDQLRLFLQPKVALASGEVIGGEALVRWVHPQRGMVAPMKFIPFAEQTGFIRVLTGWMIDRCAERSSTLRAAGHELKFAINLSTRDLVDQDLPGKVERLLARCRMDPRLICLEITESAIMDDPQRALATLERLRAMGPRLSIDDFGTGYSSLAYLKKLPVHELKIDKSFVMSMERDPADLKIVRSTIDLAHNLGLSVVAEGVESAAGYGLLRQMGCDEGQGYFIAKPMPETQFAGWLDEWAARRDGVLAEPAPAL